MNELKNNIFLIINLYIKFIIKNIYILFLKKYNFYTQYIEKYRL